MGCNFKGNQPGVFIHQLISHLHSNPAASVEALKGRRAEAPHDVHWVWMLSWEARVTMRNIVDPRHAWSSFGFPSTAKNCPRTRNTAIRAELRRRLNCCTRSFLSEVCLNALIARGSCLSLRCFNIGQILEVLRHFAELLQEAWVDKG